MLKFIPAEILKESFEVFGHFYSIEMASGEQIDCRSVLEIITKRSKPSNIDLLQDKAPDAIFIMMNPGSSKPLEEVANVVPEHAIGRLEVSIVPTKPDTTQYQVMRVMHYRDWNHVRVVNISDMRDPKSGLFVDRYVDIERRTGFLGHSLFVGGRGTELDRKLNRLPDAPVICAWGVSSDLDPLIERCLSRVSGLPGLTGLLKSNTTDKYYHPLPTLQSDKEKWVASLVSLMEAS